MAGNYPDVPGQWMPVDRDGTVGFKTDGTTYVTQLTSTELTNMVRIGSGGLGSAGGGHSRFGFVFPEIRDIAGTLAQGRGGGSTYSIETSTDTTNGLDGTWTTRATGVATVTTTSLITARTIHPVNLTAIIGFRFVQSGSGGDYANVRPFGIFGHTDPASTPDRVRFWHPTLDQPLDLNATGAYLDWGNVPQGSSEDRQFRVKNESDTLTANNIVVAAEALVDHGTIPFAGQLSISVDGVNFAAQQNIVALAPNAISPVMTVRRVAPSNAPLSVWWARLVAAPNTWT